MNDIKRQARTAGLLYVLLAILGVISLIVIPSRMIVSGDATATAERIMESGGLWRVGIAVELIGGVAFIFLAILLYRLFKGVNDLHALMMMILALMSVPIGLVGTSFGMMAQSVFSGPDFLSGMGQAQLNTMGYMFLRMRNLGTGVEAVFWGLWLFPFGLLVMRSGFIPRVLGVLLLIGGTGYVVGAFGPLLLPQCHGVISQVATVLEMGELPIIMWLAIWGARVKPAEAGSVTTG